MKKCLFLYLLIARLINPISGQEKADVANYPFLGEYQKTAVSEIRPAAWIETDTITTGWDWSLPAYVEPATNAYLCIARNSGLNKNKTENLPEINFPCNPVISH